MALVHQHLLVSATIKKPIQNTALASLWAQDLIRLLDMQMLAPPTSAYCTDKGNRGLTLLVPITTSHIALHIWDETEPAHLELDVYSCKSFHPQTVFDHLSCMNPITIKHKFLNRELL